MTARVLLKSLLAALLMPGIEAGLIPYLILHRSGDLLRVPAFSFWTVLSLAVGAGGLVMLVHAISGFAIHGKGTLAPVDPPKVLVLRGLYEKMRNPMYVGVLCVLASEAIFFRSVAILFYALAVFALFHIFVILYEEPHLRRVFGRDYEEYCRRIPRWPVIIRTGKREGKQSG